MNRTVLAAMRPIFLQVFFFLAGGFIPIFLYRYDFMVRMDILYKENIVL